MASKKFYVTTAIDYTNSTPHIGHSYQKVLADVLKRWHQSLGYDSLYLTGTDEHGLKILRAAQAANKEPQDFVDDIAAEFQKAWKKLNLDYDIFLRTTSEQHKTAVKEFIKRIAKSGDIYKGTYEGLYCVGCETFYTEKDLTNGKICPYHKKEAELIKEESYFFKLSKYQKKLLELYKKNPEFISPKNRQAEIINRVKEPLKDLSVSRSSLQWGVPFPLDGKHVTYIWFEALQCYVSGLDFPNGERFRKFWPADVQLLGTDNGWFHTVIWPAMLLSAGLKIPKKIYIHSFLTLDGQKISKSLGNTINPGILVDKYGADAVRYALLREIDPKTDSDFSEKILVERLNSDLANTLGNLLSRTLTLVEKNCGGAVPKGKPDANLKKLFEKTLKEVSEDVSEIEAHHALEKIFSFIGACNKYVDENKPWELAKNKDVRLNDILYNLAESLRVISALIWPFIPESAEKIAHQLGIGLPKLNGIKYGQIKAGTKVSKGKILFYKIDKFEPVKIGIPKETKIVSPIDLRIAEIKSAEVVADSDKLLKLQIDVGRLGQRQIVAGIRKFYSLSELIGKKIIVVANLRPAKIRGDLSQGMLLAAVDNGQDEVISPAGENGEKLFADNLLFEPAKEIEISELEKLKLKVENYRLAANGNILKTSQGEVKTKIIFSGSVR